MDVQKKKVLPEDWNKELGEEFSKDYMKDLRTFLQGELKQYIIFPPMKEVFNAYLLTPFERVKIVIIGQDPYHNPRQAHGLSFSVKKGVSLPPSLQNIYQEIYNNFSISTPFPHGELITWSKQGVFLLNSVLTVRKNQPSSHSNKGWENFTDKTIQILNQKKENLVFLLWGKFAISKKGLINNQKHLALEAPHPSPFSANRGFFGCQHFNKANDFLIKHGLKPIDWNIG